MKVMCPDCGSKLWEIDIEDRGKTKRLVIIICKQCSYSTSYTVTGEHNPKGG